MFGAYTDNYAKNVVNFLLVPWCTMHAIEKVTGPLFADQVTYVYVTRFHRTDPNRTSGKIKLTPPVDSYTIVLQVLTLSTTQTTRGWFLHTSFLGGVECSNGGFRPCERPGLARVSGLLVDSLIMLARRVLC